MKTVPQEDFLLAIETTGEQREIWNSCQFDESSSLCFNESITIEFTGKLDVLALENAIENLLDRHASLRSCFSIDGKHMMIKNHMKPLLKKIVYQNVDKVNEVEIDECSTLFDLSSGPLIRFVLLTPDEQMHSSSKSYLVMCAHHIICDGWSWAIVTSDLGHFYNSMVQKVFSALPKAAQYWNYSKYKNSVDKNKDKLFWKEVFSTDQEVINFNQVKERPVFRSFNSQRLDTTCDEEIIIKLRAKARKNKVSLYQYLLGAFIWTLSKSSDSSDITIGISQAGQTDADFSSLVGHCVGLLPIRMENVKACPFTSHLQNVKKTMLEAQGHSDISFGEICEVSVRRRDPSRVPLVPITFNLDVQPEGQGLDFINLKARFTTNPRFFENFEMFINLTLIGNKATIENQYNTDLFEKNEVAKLQETYRDLLIHLANDEEASDFSFESYHDYIEEIKNKVHELRTPDKQVSVRDTPISRPSQISSQLKEDVRNIWKEILIVDRIEDHDGFFALGGHSLLVTEVILTIKERLQLNVTMKDLFLNQEFSDFLKVISNKVSVGSVQSDESDELLHINHEVHDNQALPLSWQQQRSWLFQKINLESTLFNLPSLFQFKGDLDLNTFKKALLHFQQSHPLIQSNLIVKEGIPYWDFNKDNSRLDVEVIDLKEVYKKSKIEDIIEQLIAIHTEEANKSFNLAGPLYRAKIYFYEAKNKKDNYIFLSQMVHHIIWDGWCYDIFLNELEHNYHALTSGEALLSPLDLTYFDYAKWQSELPEKSLYQDKLNFWKNEFKNLPDPLELPSRTHLKRIEKHYNGKSHFIKWEEETVVHLEHLAKSKGTTLFNVLMTAFKLFLSKYSGQEEIIVGTPVRGRDAQDLDRIIGFFVNNVAIGGSVSSAMSFEDNLQNVSMKTSMAFENGLVPFDVIVREVVKVRDPSRTPIYQAFFMYQDATNRDTNFCGSERSSYRLPRGACHTDIDFWARRDREGMIGGFDFDTELFTDKQMEQMCSDFKFFLSNIAKSSDQLQYVKDIPFLNPTHLEYVVDQLNSTDVDFDRNQTIAQLIDTAMKRDPLKVAIACSSGEITYRQLTQLSDSFAEYLISQGVQQGQLVGMALPRNHYLPICLLGIIKAGAGYVPLDPTYPEERLAYMIQNSKLSLAICSKEDGDLELFKNIDTIKLDDPLSLERKRNKAWTTEVTEELSRRKLSISPDDTCYVIYTSGSTGLPKGVDIGHRSMVNFLQSMIKTPGISPKDTLVAVTTMSFDIAVLEIYAPLLAGAKLYICTKEESMFGDSLMDVIKHNQGTILQATPATWRQLVVSGLGEYKVKCEKLGHKFKSLCGGEPLPSDLKELILESVHELWNMYGPTETTVWSTCHQVQKGESWISIGQPIDNTQIYILSDQLELCPFGSIGEICIGGVGLAKGYLNRPDLTSERFIKCAALGDQVVYRTGDLGRFRENGLLECLGRNDGQVKVRGFRIELGEIESIISQLEGIQSQVVMVREDRPGDARIVAYFIRTADEKREEKDIILSLKKLIKGNLPFYMMPSHFIELQEFPLTLNAKIDRKKLPSPNSSHSNDYALETHILNSGELETSQKDEKLNSASSLRNEFMKIWCQCLGTESVSDEDDFFEVGGHSLLSVTLFSKIEVQLGITLPLSILFQKTKFGELLALLEEHGQLSQKENIVNLSDTVQSDYLVILRKGNGNKKAIFLFHGVGGNILNYKKLVNFIPEGYDIYGVQSPGVLGEAQLAKSVLELAILYSNDIVNLKQYDNFVFSGGSMGGLLAFETARELEEMKKKVELIIMFDTFGPREAFTNIKNAAQMSFFTRLKTYSYYKVKKLNAQFHYWLSEFSKKSVPHKYRHFLVELNNYGLMNKHIIKPFETQVHLLRGPILNEGKYSLEDLGWNKVALKGCVSHVVDNVDHEHFVESASAAKVLRKLLEGV